MEIIQWITTQNIGDIGAVSLVTMFIILIMTGRLVPKATVDEMRADRDARLESSRQATADWKAAYQSEHEKGIIQDKQVETLLEQSSTTVNLLQAIPSLNQSR